MGDAVLAHSKYLEHKVRVTSALGLRVNDSSVNQQG